MVYTEDNDDSTSAKELAEKGYTLPEYHFIAEYDGAESEMSKVLAVWGWIDQKVIDSKTKDPIVNRAYIIRTPEGEYLNGHTDGRGFIQHKRIKIMKYQIIIAEGGKDA